MEQIRSPRQAIEQLQERYLTAADDVLESLSGHSDVVQMNFAASYFPLEFIQNADDEGATSIRFRVTSGESGPVLEIFNDGRPFTEPGIATDYDGEIRADVSGLCKVGQSPKTPRDHIGFIGVGFKSIFDVSDRVEIHSGGFSFEFNRQRADEEGSNLPWRVLPWWIGEDDRSGTGPFPVDGREYTTRFVAHLREEYTDDGDVFAPLSRENIDRRVFLFLTELEEIVIEDRIAGTTRTLRRGGAEEVPDELREAIASATERYPIDLSETDGRPPIRPLVVEEEQDGEVTRDHWVVFTERWTVPDPVRTDQATENYFRSDVEVRELFVALQATPNGRLRVPPDRAGTLHTGVFSYLPLKELDTDFDFLLHADFLTPADRQTIKRDVLWNREIMDALKETLFAVVETVAEHPTWWRDLHVLVPGTDGDEFIVDQLQRPLRKHVDLEPLLRDTEGQLGRANDRIRVSDPVVTHLTAEEVKDITKRRPLHPAQRETHRRLRSGGDTHDFFSLLQNESAPEVFDRIAGKDRAPTVFAAILEELAEEQARYRHPKALRHTGLLTDDGRAVGHESENVYYSAQNALTEEFDADPFDDIESEIQVLHREVSRIAGKAAETVYENVNIDPISDGEIVRIWLETVDFLEQTEADRRQAARVCFRSVQNGEVDADEIEGLRLETTAGKWLPPEKLLLPEVYKPTNPAHRLSAFAWLDELPEGEKRKRFAGIDELEASLQFVSEQYLRSGDDARDWRSFLRDLGVDTIVTEDETRGAFIGAIGELFVYHRLTERYGGPPRNSRIGHDLERGDIGGEREIIEVKSTNGETLAFRLTRSQTEVLKANEDSYWVYVATEALQQPRVTKARGRVIQKRGETSIEVPAQTWQEIASTFQ